RHCMVLGLVMVSHGYTQDTSQYIVQERGAYDSDNHARLLVEIRDLAAQETPVPVRVIVTASEGSHPDGSGHGVYADGRFYADGHFEVVVPRGTTRIDLRGGPHFVPLKIQEAFDGGHEYHISVSLHQWFSPELRGWYCGDNHVHALHDSQAMVKASLDYAALQGRANGLNWITEAGSNVPYDRIDQLDTASFLLRYAQEQRLGAYVGHVNTPGITRPIGKAFTDTIMARPLPVQAVKTRVHELDGVVVHTHPLTPPYQLHWMGAMEFFSDAVMGRCADLLDIDSRATEYLWFMALNLGNRVAASGSTDSALGRVKTASPGDRRVYCRAETFTYPAIIEGLRQGRTVATNGGAFFPLFEMDGREPGDVIELKDRQKFTARMEIQTLAGVRTAQLYRNGVRVWAENLTGRTGPIELEKVIEESQTCWYVFRVEDAQGNWAITSPIYFNSTAPPAELRAEAILLAINNCTRFIELRRTFYAHVIATVSEGEQIEAVELLRDGQVIQAFLAAQGDQLKNNRVPVTQLEGEYEPGWVWYPDPAKAVHFQCDYPVQDTGWYAVRIQTDTGRTVTSDGIRFDASHANSRTLSVAHLSGSGSSLTLRGYGEEMPLADIQLPFVGDAWWYPKNTYWQMIADFGQGVQHLGGGWEGAESNFRPAH
ncbi:MAG: CehA/McbA family metallohydrolase, partial [Phycisphaerae bacterium]|nr:CehA/McbA family metallohydrolase [Phycisphaerae bacterium]